MAHAIKMAHGAVMEEGQKIVKSRGDGIWLQGNHFLQTKQSSFKCELAVIVTEDSGLKHTQAGPNPDMSEGRWTGNRGPSWGATSNP